MRKKTIFIFILILITSIDFCFGQELKQKIKNIDNEINDYNLKINKLRKDKEEFQLKYIREQLKEYALPKLEEGEELIEHLAYMLVYSEKHEQAKWVVHIISKEIIEEGAGRSNDFRPDPKIKTGSAVEEDYFLKQNKDGQTVYDGFGYDRGHLAPSADFKWSKAALSETYFYSNMSPQLADFNREGWAKLEGMLRTYVCENEIQLFVVTAPVLNDTLSPIFRSINKVSVPEYFYKIAFDKENNIAIGFLIPHKKLEYPIEFYAVSIDSIEALTGIDFFSNLNDSLEIIIEKQTDYKPFLPKKSKFDIAPLKELPKRCVNTVQAKQHVNSNKKITVCGTVVSTHKSRNNHVFINIDKAFPNQIFSITIWASDIVNFSYKPEQELTGKKICVTGKIVEYDGTPSIYVDNEKHIEILD
jgi:endonuclease G